MPLRPDMVFRDYVALILRRKWVCVFSILFIIFGASVYCIVSPELYRSSTTILIIPQSVPQDYVKSTISVRLEEQLATIKQQVLSRTTLVRLMDDLKLYPVERTKRPVEDVVEMIRRRIEILVVDGRRGTGRDGGDAFTLSFVHEDPQVAMLAAARLASFFIDENLKTREQQAVGTSEFLESQMKETKARLEAQETRVKDYKMQYMGELPQQMEANLRMLTGLQDRLRSNADGIRTVEDRKVFLEAQVKLLEMSLQTSAPDNGQVVTAIYQDPAEALVAELNAKKTRLADLSARYTDRYPEVVRVTREVTALEKRIADVRQSPAEPVADDRMSAPVQRPRQSGPAFDELRRMKAQVGAASAEIAALKHERTEIQRSIGGVEEKIGKSPRREQEMISMLRDYDNLKRSYDELLRKKLEADISQNLEKRQKGTQFQVLDAANLPEEPFKPERKRVMGFGLLIALAVGFGGTIGLEMIDPTLRGVDDFKHYFNIPVLACIPAMQSPRYRRSRALRRAALLGGFIILTTALSVFLFVYDDEIRRILNL